MVSLAQLHIFSLPFAVLFALLSALHCPLPSRSFEFRCGMKIFYRLSFFFLFLMCYQQIWYLSRAESKSIRTLENTWIYSCHCSWAQFALLLSIRLTYPSPIIRYMSNKNYRANQTIFFFFFVCHLPSNCFFWSGKLVLISVLLKFFQRSRRQQQQRLQRRQRQRVKLATINRKQKKRLTEEKEKKKNKE